MTEIPKEPQVENITQPFLPESPKQEISSLKQEIQELKLENHLLKQQAVKDPQTELLNKKGLQEAEEKIIGGTLRDIAEGKDEERKVRTIFFDLNNLKGYAGDEFVLFLRKDTRNAEEYLNIQGEKYPDLKFSGGVVDLDLNELYEKVVSEVGNGQKNYHLIQEKMLDELRKTKELADAAMYQAKNLNKEKSNFVFTNAF